ncbi:MAG: hypothetical protein WBD40_03290 [Tepidisphaeraceae bacterium]
MKTTTVRVEDELWTWMGVEAERLGVSHAMLVRIAVRDYRRREESAQRITDLELRAEEIERATDDVQTSVGSVDERVTQLERTVGALARARRASSGEHRS